MAPSANAARGSTGDEPALDDADPGIPEGMIFALLGANGVGSTWRRPWSEPPA